MTVIMSGQRQTFDIMVDIDDVVVPWFETVHNKCGELGLHDGLPPKRVSWRMWEDYGCTEEQWQDAVIAATEDGLYTSTEPFPYAVEAINRLRWNGHRVHIVTARGFMANGENIRRWTKEYLPRFGIGHDTLTFAKDKVGAMTDLGTKFDYAIDDGVHNYTALDEAGVPVYLMDAPHNQDFFSTRRVSSLWQFSEIVLGAAW